MDTEELKRILEGKSNNSTASKLWTITKCISSFAWIGSKFVAKNTPTVLGAAWQIKKEISQGVSQVIHEAQQEHRKLELEKKINNISGIKTTESGIITTYPEEVKIFSMFENNQLTEEQKYALVKYKEKKAKALRDLHTTSNRATINADDEKLMFGEAFDAKKVESKDTTTKSEDVLKDKVFTEEEEAIYAAATTGDAGKILKELKLTKEQIIAVYKLQNQIKA